MVFLRVCVLCVRVCVLCVCLCVRVCAVAAEGGGLGVASTPNIGNGGGGGSAPPIVVHLINREF